MGLITMIMIIIIIFRKYIWRPSSLSELTTMVIIMELTHLGSEASI